MLDMSTCRQVLGIIGCFAMMMSWRSWWGRFAARLVAGSAQKPNTLVVFGLMIDSPPAHPDIVITMLVNLERAALNSFGMQYTNITVDLQLNHTACLVQRHDPLRWTNVILHQSMMHTFMSFLGCIGTLMKASIWRGQCSICWHHQHSQWKGQCSMGMPSHHCRVAAEFLLEWHQDIWGADCLQ